MPQALERGYTNFYEKALFVKVDVATALWLTQPLCPSRYASIRTFGELTLRWLSALWHPSFRATTGSLLSIVERRVLMVAEVLLHDQTLTRKSGSRPT